MFRPCFSTEPLIILDNSTKFWICRIYTRYMDRKWQIRQDPGYSNDAIDRDPVVLQRPVFQQSYRLVASGEYFGFCRLFVPDTTAKKPIVPMLADNLWRSGLIEEDSEVIGRHWRSSDLCYAESSSANGLVF